MEQATPSAPETRFEPAILDALGTAAILVGPQGLVSTATPHLAHLTGEPIHTLAGQPLGDLFHPEDRQRAAELLAEASGTPEVLRMRHTEEAWVAVEVTAVPTQRGPIVQGAVLAVRAVGTDLMLDEPVKMVADEEPLPDVLAGIAALMSRGNLRTPVSILWDRHNGSFTGALHADVTSELEDAIDHALDDDDGPAMWAAPTPGGTGFQQFQVASLPPAIALAAAGAGFESGLLVPFSDAPGPPLGLMILWSTAADPSLSPARCARMERLRWIATIAAARDKDNARLLHATSHDPLTGLANRSRFYSVVERQSHRGEVVVMYVDIEQFSRFNAHFGTGVGDEVLIEVAGRLQEVMRPTDVVARLGADEFAVVLGESPSSEVCATVAERMRAAIQLPIMTTVGSIQVKARVRESRPTNTPATPRLA